MGSNSNETTQKVDFEKRFDGRLERQLIISIYTLSRIYDHNYIDQRSLESRSNPISENTPNPIARITFFKLVIVVPHKHFICSSNKGLLPDGIRLGRYGQQRRILFGVS